MANSVRYLATPPSPSPQEVQEVGKEFSKELHYLLESLNIILLLSWDLDGLLQIY